MLYRFIFSKERRVAQRLIDVRRFEAMEKAIRRDIHKMRAFVRFRMIGEGDGERYVAWFEPDHFIVEKNAAFFVRRFTGMHWTILTPHACACWDGENLAIGPGASKEDAPAEDATEELKARVGAMKAQAASC